MKKKFYARKTILLSLVLAFSGLMSAQNYAFECNFDSVDTDVFPNLDDGQNNADWLVADGMVSYTLDTAVAAPPRMISNVFDPQISGDDFKYINIRVKNTSDSTKLKVLWRRGTIAAYKNKVIDITAHDEDFKVYSIDMSGNFWDGETIRQLRVDCPNNKALGDTGTITFDYITLSDTLPLAASLILAEELSLSIFPIPAKGLLNVSHEVAIKQVQVMSLSGALMLQQVANESSVQLDVSSLASGIYILHVLDVNNKRIASKIIKE